MPKRISWAALLYANSLCTILAMLLYHQYMGSRVKTKILQKYLGKWLKCHHIALCVHKRVSWEHNPLRRGFQFKKLQMGALSTSNNKGLKSLFKFSQILSSGFSSVKWIMLHTKRASSYIDADFELFLIFGSKTALQFLKKRYTIFTFFHISRRSHSILLL